MDDTLSNADVTRHAEEVAERGFTVVEAALDDGLVDDLVNALARLEDELGIEPADNSFEGTHTRRIYNLLAHDAVFQRIPTHPAILPIVDAVLGDGALLSTLSSITIEPGETAQPIHADDQLIPIAKPHDAVVCNSMLALTDFTEENGATRLVPGSHTADASPEYGSHHPTVPAEMPRGSVLIWHGSLWHGGGANRTDERRIGIANNYCAGFIRQQENQQLGLAPELVGHFEPRLQQLVGYSVYRGLIGHIDKADPRSLLGATSGKMVWDAS